MEILKEYEISPIKSIFSNKNVKKESPNDVLFNISKDFGFLSKNEYDLLLGLMNKEVPNLKKEELEKVLKDLMERGIVEKKTNS